MLEYVDGIENTSRIKYSVYELKKQLLFGIL